ncbi:MAG: hypothetical protein VX191_00305 [Candidatus Thermoplasmatota archaeon]|nr:hypothetical protein [Candidatus Thermoplasmatota archaeon]
MADTQSILAALLSISAGLLIWVILRLRQKLRMSNANEIDEYSGRARNPEDLMDPDAEALAQLDQLLDGGFDSEE